MQLVFERVVIRELTDGKSVLVGVYGNWFTHTVSGTASVHLLVSISSFSEGVFRILSWSMVRFMRGILNLVLMGGVLMICLIIILVLTQIVKRLLRISVIWQIHPLVVLRSVVPSVWHFMVLCELLIVSH